jgi:UPF0271 protein
MDACVRLAKRFAVRVGAHPGLWSRNDFGRGQVELVPEELELLLLQQVGAFERVARRHRVKLHHIKLHGALYHASEENEALGRGYLEAVGRWWPDCIVYVRAGGRVAKLARRAGLRTWEEAFVDRNYSDDGSLVPRSEANGLFTDRAAVRRRVQRLSEFGEVETVSGWALRLHPQTVCLHSDTPNVIRLARTVACLLGLKR